MLQPDGEIGVGGGGSHTAASPSECNSCNFETICSRRWHLIQKHDINPQLCVKIRQGEGENEEGEEKSNVYSQSLVVQRAWKQLRQLST